REEGTGRVVQRPRQVDPQEGHPRRVEGNDRQSRQGGQGRRSRQGKRRRGAAKGDQLQELPHHLQINRTSRGGPALPGPPVVLSGEGFRMQRTTRGLLLAAAALLAGSALAQDKAPTIKEIMSKLNKPGGLYPSISKELKADDTDWD